MSLGKALLSLTALAMGLIVSQPAHALIDLRAHYTELAVSPDSMGSFPHFDQLTGFGADLIISPPVLPLAVGVRYEKLATDKSNSFGTIDLTATRLAALGSIRIIDTLIFIGGIGTVGLNHGGRAKFTEFSGPTMVKDNDIEFSYTLGIEGGFKLIGFILGAEIGYSGLKIKDAPQGNIDLSGSYLKTHIGLNF